MSELEKKISQTSYSKTNKFIFFLPKSGKNMQELTYANKSDFKPFHCFENIKLAQKGFFVQAKKVTVNWCYCSLPATQMIRVKLGNRIGSIKIIRINTEHRMDYIQ